MKRLALVVAVGCGTAKPPPPPPPIRPVAARPAFTTSTIALPGGTADGVGMDYLLFDPRTKALWVPAGNTGAVDVIDTTSGRLTLTRIDGFATREIEGRGRRRMVGPSAAALGAPGTVYIGNRGDASVCAVDEVKLVTGTCTTLDATPDGVVYVAPTHEVWVTTPRDNSIRILDATTLAPKAKLELAGNPEGYAVDAKRGRFYTNLEDQDATLAIDLVTHSTVATWKPGCGEQGPHGLRLAEPEGFLLVACSATLEVLDVGHDGAILGSLATGEGVDDFDYDEASHQAYVGASEAGMLTIATLDRKGALASTAQVQVAQGSHNGVIDDAGRIYLAHGRSAELVVVTPGH